jgi:surface antigen
VSALSVSGCSYRLLSFTSTDDGDAAMTGAVMPAGDRPVHVADASQPTAVDLVYARAAAADALSRGGKDTSVPWVNPNSGAGGNITPLDSGYSQDGLRCRDFLASYEHGGSQDWLQGSACRNTSGVWDVRRLKPLKPS